MTIALCYLFIKEGRKETKKKIEQTMFKQSVFKYDYERIAKK